MAYGPVAVVSSPFGGVRGGVVGWDKDATYKYYKHGPLKRMEIGEDNIQGMDYVYTLQGWLKGINHPTLSVANDPGGATDNDNLFSRDAFGMVLGYDSLDFNRTGSPFNSLTASLISSQTGGLTNLYNGNISSWTLQTDSIGVNKAGQMGFKYKYDQLGRIKTEDYHSYVSSTWSNPSTTYDNTYEYDANGNITSLIRNGSGTAMDDMDYQYETVANGYGTNTNKLRSVDDVVSSGNYATDIDDQSSNNYKYDAIGNLVEDVQGSIDTILWTVYGKVKQVKKINGDKVEFRYDASGDRVSKTVTPYATGIALVTYYVRDASGNDMSIYEGRNSGHNYAYTLKEVPIFGSERIGTYKPDKLVKTDNNFCFTGAIYYSSQDIGHSNGLYGRSVGKKEYEMKDFLGNVRVIVGDRKLSNGRFADIKSYSNYFAGGAELVGKIYNSNAYRYGYQGSEVDEEIGGDRNHITTYYREGDLETEQWWSPDNAKPNANESPYAMMGRNPIWHNDVRGDTIRPTMNNSLSGSLMQNTVRLNQFKKSFEEAYNYLKVNNASEVLDKLNSLPQDVPLKETDKKISYYSPSDNTIYWNPKIGLLTDNFYEMSPAEILSHEGDHDLGALTNPFVFIINANTPDKDYSQLEDKRVITGSEQNVAKKLGKLSGNEVTRTEHKKGTLIETNGVTSGEDKHTIKITGTQKKSK